MVDLGTDINSSWTIENGDLQIVQDENNLIQSIQNRLSCPEGSLDYFYTAYGSKLWSYMGWRKNEETLAFMKNELNETFRQDPRIESYALELEFIEDGNLRMDLDIVYGEEQLEVNLVLDKDNMTVVTDGD